MTLLPSSILAAAQIDSINLETESFVRAQLRRAYDLIHSTGDAQSVLDALGTNAALAMMRYGALWQALTAIGAAGDLPEPIATIYVINADGTVTYTPPPVVDEPSPVEPPTEPAP